MGTPVAAFTYEDGWFSSCPSDVVPTPVGAVPVPYVVLTADEAVRWFSLMESLTLTPAGTCTNTYTDAAFPASDYVRTATFSRKLVLPDVGSDGAGTWSLEGNLGVGLANESDPSSDIPLTLYPPAKRVCPSFGTFLVSGGYSYIVPPVNEFGVCTFYLRYISGEFRLYYSFDFFLFKDTEPGDSSHPEIGIASADRAITTGDSRADVTGTFSFMGKTFDWTAYTLKDVVDVGPPLVSYTYVLSGVSLTASNEDYYEPPAY